MAEMSPNLVERLRLAIENMENSLQIVQDAVSALEHGTADDGGAPREDDEEE